jgi:peroxiredoxin
LPSLAELFEAGASLSGLERNHLFVSCAGDEFNDLAGLWGVDDVGDGRGTALLDFDRDGRTDLALMNANAPSFRLYRNELEKSGGFVALRLEGGNREFAPSEEWSNRDGFGARITASLGGRTLLREAQAGEGFASQNSRTLILGLGAAPQIDRLEVRWPSGRTSELSAIPAATLVTVREDTSGVGHTREPYRPTKPPPGARGAPSRGAALPAALPRPSTGRLGLYTSFATWCQVCAAEALHTRALREAMRESELALYGVPVDEDDDADKLQAWQQQMQPGYEVLATLPLEARRAFERMLGEQLGREALPSSVVTDPDGRVLLATFGLPSLSELARMQAALRD